MHNTSPLLIAIHGLPGTGKDTFANTLIEDNLSWSKISFAAPLKRGLSAMLNIPMEDIDNPLIKNEPNYKYGRSIRYMLQTLGTQWGRDLITDDIWMQLATEHINAKLARGINVVNTDLRFPNEAKLIKDMGGYIIHIVRDNNKSAETAAITGVASHSSDAGISANLIDKTIYNSCSLEMFKCECIKIVNDIALERL